MKLRLPDMIGFDTREEHVFADGSCAEKGDVSAFCRMEQDALGVYLRAQDTPVEWVTLVWRLRGDDRRSEPVKVFSDCWERGYGDLQWSDVIPHRRMPWAFAVSNGTDSVPDMRGRLTECFGVKVRPGAVAAWMYEPGRVTLILDVRSGGEGVVLAGRELAACRVRMEDYSDQSAFSALKSFYRTLCDDPLLPASPVYGSNNWYYAYGKSSRARIIEDAALISRLSEGLAPRPYMVIDAGWSECPGAGPWDRGNPDYGDMGTLAAEIASAGAVPGIWVRYLSDEEGRMQNVPPAWRLKRNPKYLDPSHPEVLRYVREVTQLLSAEWGYRLIKHDFSCFDVFGDWGFRRPETLTDGGWRFFDQSRTSAEIMADFYRTIYESAFPGTVILACNVPGFLTAGLCHINRVGDDTSGREWARTRRMGVNTLAFHAMHDGAFYKADHDCVGITGRIAWTLNSRWAELLSFSGTPLFFSTQPDVPSPAEFRDISACLARGASQNHSAVPLDWMENCCPERWLLDGTEKTFDWTEI